MFYISNSAPGSYHQAVQVFQEEVGNFHLLRRQRRRHRQQQRGNEGQRHYGTGG